MRPLRHKRLRHGLCLLGACASFTLPALATEPSPRAADGVVAVTDEPLHVVRHRSPKFLMYTNYIMPGTWTLYHAHRNDLLAVIAGDTVSVNQALNGSAGERSVPAGTAVLFPYADMPSGYVHRVSVTGDKPFINVGLEFLAAVPGAEQLATQMAGVAKLPDAAYTLIAETRRGRAYRVLIAAGQSLDLPQQGSAVLLVAVGDTPEHGVLTLDTEQGSTSWAVKQGDYRFFEAERPMRMTNASTETVRAVVFQAF